jgi:hypothetical protein
MEHIIRRIFTNDIGDIHSLADEYYSIPTCFNDMDNSLYEGWQYSLKHLPKSIFMTGAAVIRYVLHFPGDHFFKPNAKSKHFTFDGALMFDGEYRICDGAAEAGSCVIHINLRDIYTDAMDFISNLMQHIKFMEINAEDTIVVCSDKEESRYDTRVYLESVLANSNIAFGDGVTKRRIPLSTHAPRYSVRFNSFDIPRSMAALDSKWDGICASLFRKIKRFCGAEDVEIHVIQGSTQNMTLMTTSHPRLDFSSVTLEDKYGGAFKSYDEYIAKMYRLFYRSKETQYDILSRIETKSKKWFKTDKMDNIRYNLIYLKNAVYSDTMDAVFRNFRKDNVVILNIHYSFGSLSYNIAKSMKRCFSDSLRSFSVIGKAGGISNAAKLNDYVIADTLGISFANCFRDIPGLVSKIPIDTDGIDRSLVCGKNVSVHKAGVKIMPCVLFEPIAYLKNLRREYTAIEMEGYWFKLGLGEDVPGNYLYYISDLPLVPRTEMSLEEKNMEDTPILYNGMIRMVFRWMQRKFGLSADPKAQISRCLLAKPPLRSAKRNKAAHKGTAKYRPIRDLASPASCVV